MAEINCLKFGRERGKYSTDFNLTNDEEYYVQIYVSSARMYRAAQDFTITMEFKRNLNLFIRVKIYNAVSGYFYNKTIVLHNRKRTSTTSSCSLTDQNFLLISISRISQSNDFRNYDLSLPSCSSRVPIMVQKVEQEKKEAVVGEKLQQLSSDMENLLQTGYLSDIVITDGTTEIYAHKLILSARSPVFTKMLQCEMKETVENIVVITDISINALKKLLNFMYTGIIEITDVEIAIELYMAGDKYEIKDLKEVCSRKLMEVDLDNVLQVTVLSHLYHDKPLKEAAVSFIFDNFSQVKTLESWRNLTTENKALAIEILNSIVDKIGVSQKNTNKGYTASAANE